MVGQPEKLNQGSPRPARGPTPEFIVRPPLDEAPASGAQAGAKELQCFLAALLTAATQAEVHE